MPDPVLHSCVGAVSGFQERHLPGPGTGGDGLVKPAVIHFELGQWRTGVGAFPADDDPHPGRPAGQVKKVGDLGDVPALPDVSVGEVMAVRTGSVTANPTGQSRLRPRLASCLP